MDQLQEIKIGLQSEAEGILNELLELDVNDIKVVLEENNVSTIAEFSKLLDEGVEESLTQASALSESEQLEILVEAKKSKKAKAGFFDKIKSSASTAKKYVQKKATQAGSTIKTQASKAGKTIKANPGKAVAIGASLGLLVAYIRVKTAWSRTYAKYEKAKASGNKELANKLAVNLKSIKTKMADSDAKLKAKIQSMSPEQRTAFNSRKSKVIAQAMQRANV